MSKLSKVQEGNSCNLMENAVKYSQQQGVLKTSKADSQLFCIFVHIRMRNNTRIAVSTCFLSLRWSIGERPFQSNSNFLAGLVAERWNQKRVSLFLKDSYDVTMTSKDWQFIGFSSSTIVASGQDLIRHQVPWPLARLAPHTWSSEISPFILSCDIMLGVKCAVYGVPSWSLQPAVRSADLGAWTILLSITHGCTNTNHG